MRIVFMGTPQSAVPSLQTLLADGHEIVAVWSQPDKPAGRGKQLHAPPVKQFALDHSIPVYQPAKIRTAEARDLFASHLADVAVVVAYGRILPDEFLTTPKFGAVNVHFSLLPKYRGAAPVNWALVNGDDETGVTTMRIVAELDAGPILLQESTKIQPDETAPQLLARLAELGANLIGETLEHLPAIRPRAQSTEEVSYAPILKRENGLIDWSADAFAIERRVRGFQPWPNAFTMLGQQRLIVWKAVPEISGNLNGHPGEIIEVGHDISVACGAETRLRLLEVQKEGGRRISVRDFLNGTHLRVGQKLG